MTDVSNDGTSLDKLVAARLAGIEAWSLGGVELMREQSGRGAGDEGVLVVTQQDGNRART